MIFFSIFKRIICCILLPGYILRYTFTSISSIAFLPNNLPNVPLIQVAAISCPEFVQRYVASANDMFSSDELPTTCKAPTYLTEDEPDCNTVGTNSRGD